MKKETSNYLQQVTLLDDEKREIYMRKSKEELIEMMLEQERLIDKLTKNRDFYYTLYLNATGK